MLTVCCAAQDFCPSPDPVYPYWSLCNAPAKYREPYNLASSTLERLIAEWDESNSTYYIRLTETFGEGGDEFTLLPLDFSASTVYHNATVSIASSVSGSSYLSWRREGDAEWFLQLSDSESDAANFQLVYAPDVLLPCPLVYGARCEAYYLLSAPGSYTSGLTAYVEDEATYITLGQEGSNGDLPLLLHTTSTSGNRHTVA